MKDLDLPVEEFTTPNPVTANENDPIDALAHLMAKHGIRHLPILRHGEVVGVVSERDLKVVQGLDVKEKSLVLAKHIMAHDPFTVDSESSLDQVAFEMSKRKIGSVIVTEQGKFLGIFTSTDALNALIEIVRAARR